MNWINNVVRPKIRGFLGTRREVPDDMWRTDPESGQMVYSKDLEANQFVFPGSNYHERMTAPQRLAHMFDDGVYTKVAVPAVPLDPLKFRDSIKYPDRLKEARAKTELDDSVLVGEGKLEGQDVVAAAHDMRFVGGSPSDAIGHSIRMRDITVTRHPTFTIPMLDFSGTAFGIDIRAVVDTGIVPVINTGIAHRAAGVGQIGAGITGAPWECFRAALPDGLS